MITMKSYDIDCFLPVVVLGILCLLMCCSSPLICNIKIESYPTTAPASTQPASRDAQADLEILELRAECEKGGGK
jgi:hypothetical protein